MKILGDRSIVHIIVEAPERRARLVSAVERCGGRAHVHARLQDFLAHATPWLHGCLVIEAAAGGANALEPLWHASPLIPVIVVSAPSDVETAVEVMKRGAFDCIEVPMLEEEDLLASITAALRRDADNWSHVQRQAELRARVESLTPREREVMSLLTAGTLNKIIASRLGLSRRTVETHRTNVMIKMQASSVAQLINMSLLLSESAARRHINPPVARRETHRMAEASAAI